VAVSNRRRQTELAFIDEAGTVAATYGHTTLEDSVDKHPPPAVSCS